MPKYLVTCSKTKVIFRKISKTNRPLAVVYDRLYRIDDSLAIRDDCSNDSIIIYDVDEQQPYGDGSYLDPEFTKTLIDSMKLAKGKPARLLDFNMQTVTTILVVVAVAISVLSVVMQ